MDSKLKVVFHRFGNICEQDIIDSFNRLNLQVIEDDIEIYSKNIDGEKRVGILAEMILHNKPLFVFSINFFPYISEICEHLGVVYICWSVDCPVQEVYSKAIQNKNNRVFLFDYKQYLSVVDFNQECIFYLPLATNIERWQSVLREKIENPEYKYDISFVGSMYNEESIYSRLDLSEFYKGYFDSLIESQLMFPGIELLEETLDEEKVSTLIQSFKRSIPQLFEKYNVPNTLFDMNKYIAVNNILGFELSSIDRFRQLNTLARTMDVHLFTKSETDELTGINVHESVHTHTEMPKVFSSSKINLNITMRGIRTGLSQRIWDVLGCGGFLMTNYQSEIPDYFQNGVDLVCFENEEECVELAKYYLTNEDERKQIALTGYNSVCEKNTYDLRVSQMIKTAMANLL